MPGGVGALLESFAATNVSSFQQMPDALSRVAVVVEQIYFLRGDHRGASPFCAIENAPAEARQSFAALLIGVRLHQPVFCLLNLNSLAVIRDPARFVRLATLRPY